MFKRKKRFKPYRMKPIRVKSWREIAWVKVMSLLVGTYGILFALLQELWGSIELACSDQGFSHDHRHHHDSDWFEQDSGMFENDCGMIEHDSGMFEHDDDDISRGLWDVTSTYYPMFHSD